jgi:hypothetical protein
MDEAEYLHLRLKGKQGEGVERAGPTREETSTGPPGEEKHQSRRKIWWCWKTKQRL